MLARWPTGNETDAEDVVQDACLRAFRAIAGFEEGKARAWLLTMVRNTAYTWLGKNRSPALVVTDDPEGVEAVDIRSATIRLMGWRDGIGRGGRGKHRPRQR